MNLYQLSYIRASEIKVPGYVGNWVSHIREIFASANLNHGLVKLWKIEAELGNRVTASSRLNHTKFINAVSGLHSQTLVDLES